MVSDLRLLIAAQAAGASAADRERFWERFAKFLNYCAGRQCLVHKLDIASVPDVVGRAMVMFFDGRHARFDPASCQGHLSYLEGLVRNAAKAHWRFIHKGEGHHQDWRDPLVYHMGLPTCIEEVGCHQRVPPVEVAEDVAVALSVATPDELILIHRHFFHHETIGEIAVSMGVARTTVTRRLDRFYARAAAQLAA